MDILGFFVTIFELTQIFLDLLDISGISWICRIFPDIYGFFWIFMDFPKVLLKHIEFPIFRFDPSVDGDPTVEGGQKFRHRTILCMPIMYSNKPNKVLGVFQLGTVHQILSPISDSESTNF